ncbi:MAG TPA: hypothetical protein VF705_11535 [Longimicrobium sp.]|jgi:hypothetical protein
MADRALEVVDGVKLDDELRRILRPGELMRDRDGRLRRLPRFFYRVPDWEAALEMPLSPHFEIWEFLNVDVRETERLRSEWPRFLPCAVSLVASFLELFRREVDTYVHIAANGGYRSPAHRLSTHASTHCWGTAANIYRVGDDWLDDEKTIAKYARVAGRLMPGVYTRPYGHGVAEADDHLHLDLGWTIVVPHGMTGERARREDPVDEAHAEGVGTETSATETAGAGA